MREMRRFAVGLLLGAALVPVAGRVCAEDDEKGLTLEIGRAHV